MKVYLVFSAFTSRLNFLTVSNTGSSVFFIVFIFLPNKSKSAYVVELNYSFSTFENKFTLLISAKDLFRIVRLNGGDVTNFVSYIV